jgi:5-methylcytosine-specific restriction endonuclease McrA
MGRSIEENLADDFLATIGEIQRYGYSVNKKPKRKKGKREAGSLSYKAWRYAVFTRDKFTCQKCGIVLSAEDLEAHHLKPFSVAPELQHIVSNGLTLCHKCHVETDSYGGRGHYKENEE